MQLRALFSHCFMLRRLVDLRLVYLFDYLSDACVDLFVSLNLFSRIDKEDICTSFCQKRVLLFAPAFSDSAFEQVSLHGSFEHLFGNRNHDSVQSGTGAGHIQKPQPGNIPVLPFGKQLSYRGLAAEPFLFRKGVRILCVQFISLKDISRVPLQPMGPLL